MFFSFVQGLHVRRILDYWQLVLWLHDPLDHCTGVVTRLVLPLAVVVEREPKSIEIDSSHWRWRPLRLGECLTKVL